MTILGVSVPDKEALRRSVPLAGVCFALGVRVDDDGYAACPFHDDRNPSFNVWEAQDGTQRWGCFVCDLVGDHYDLVRRVRDVSFGEALRFVASLDGTYAPPVSVRRRTELDADALLAYVSAAQRRALEPASVGLLCVAADLRDERLTHAERSHVDTVLRELGWGVDDRANVVIPHYTRDGQLCGAKVRAINGAKWSFPGSRYDSLYGVWRPNHGWRRCLLTEGETDFAHAVLSEPPAHLLSVPSGAKFRESWVEQVSRFERVYLALDHDTAGERATSRWSDALGILSVETVILPIAEGEDLRSCGVSVQTLMEEEKLTGLRDSGRDRCQPTR